MVLTAVYCIVLCIKNKSLDFDSVSIPTALAFVMLMVYLLILKMKTVEHKFISKGIPNSKVH